MDHKTTIQRVNFVTPAPIVTSSAKAPFAIEVEAPPAPQQQENLKLCIQSFARAITFFYFCFKFNTSKFGGNLR